MSYCNRLLCYPKFMLFAAIMLAMAACNGSSPRSADLLNHPDAASGLADKGAALDSSSSATDLPSKDLACPDLRAFNPRFVLLAGPRHLTSNLGTDVKVWVSIHPVDQPDPKAAKAAITSAFSLVSLPGKKPVAGKLTLNYKARRASFVPTSKFTLNTTYLIRLKKGHLVAPLREYSLFRVGSLPQVRGISTRAKQATPSEMDYIGIDFSEPVDRAKAIAAISIRSAKTNVALKLKPAASTGVHTGILFYAPAGTRMADALNITVGIDVGAPTGVKLDGKYTGKPGSGSFKVQIVPAKNAAGWEPALSF